jgi:hypothetical protein
MDMYNYLVVVILLILELKIIIIHMLKLVYNRLYMDLVRLELVIIIFRFMGYIVQIMLLMLC